MSHLHIFESIREASVFNWGGGEMCYRQISEDSPSEQDVLKSRYSRHSQNSSCCLFFWWILPLGTLPGLQIITHGVILPETWATQIQTFLCFVFIKNLVNRTALNTGSLDGMTRVPTQRGSQLLMARGIQNKHTFLNKWGKVAFVVLLYVCKKGCLRLQVRVLLLQRRASVQRSAKQHTHTPTPA